MDIIVEETFHIQFFLQGNRACQLKPTFSSTKVCCIWDKVFKSGQSKIFGRQPYSDRPYPFKFFKDCIPQILLGSLLNSLFHLSFDKRFTEEAVMQRFLSFQENVQFRSSSPRCFIKRYSFKHNGIGWNPVSSSLTGLQPAALVIITRLSRRVTQGFISAL